MTFIKYAFYQNKPKLEHVFAHTTLVGIKYHKLTNE